MTTTLPGTTIEVSEIRKGISRQLFDGIFAAGGITLSQVAVMTDLEPYRIQNWVKRGFVSSPQRRQYSKKQFARIVIIHMLCESLQLDRICELLSYINGNLHDESDDIIDDTVLYFKFVSLAARARHIGGTKEWGEALTEVMENYAEPYPGAKEKVKKVLQIMLTAWIVSQLREQTNQMISQL